MTKTNNNVSEEVKEAVCYIRGDEEVKNQLDEVVERAKKDGYKPTYVFVDNDSVLKPMAEREGIKDMIRCISDTNHFSDGVCPIKALYVYDLSRLSRKMEDLKQIGDFLLENKVKLVSVVMENQNDAIAKRSMFGKNHKATQQNPENNVNTPKNQ